MAHRRSSRLQRPWHRRVLALSPTTLLVATILLAASDWGARLAGETVFPGGPLDEIAHVLTTLLVFWALGPRVCKRFLVPALIASAAIDLDHIPGRLGAEWLTAGTQRPYSHSLLTIAVVLAIAQFSRRRRDLALGIAIGLVFHFWRDMGEGGSGVSLLWPISYHSFQYPHGVYVAAIAVFVAIDAARCASDKQLIDRAPRRRPSAAHPGSFVRTPEEAWQRD
jgi:inner membrane protein